MGFKVQVGRVRAEIDPKLEATIRQMFDLSYRKIVTSLEEIGEEVSMDARLNWYKGVLRRTGETGKVGYSMILLPDKLQVVVHPDATDRTYYVRRPGPNSTVTIGTDEFTYARMMSIYRKTGQLPSEFRDIARFTPNGRPTGLYKREPNPKASDGGSQWKTWVLDPGKRLAKRLRDRGSEELNEYVERKLRRVG